MFRLQFEGQVTSSLNFDAGANDVRLAMEGLSTVGTVVVTRTGPSYQNGYAWTITFNDPMNAGQSMTHPHPTIEHNTTQCTILMTYPIVISTLSNHPHTLSITPIIPPPPPSCHFIPPGNVPAIIPQYAGLTVSSLGASVNMTVASTDGNQIGGFFTVSWTNQAGDHDTSHHITSHHIPLNNTTPHLILSLTTPPSPLDPPY